MMSVDTNTDYTPPTTGLDAVDYGPYAQIIMENTLLVYGLDGDDAWIESDLFVGLDDRT